MESIGHSKCGMQLQDVRSRTALGKLDSLEGSQHSFLEDSPDYYHIVIRASHEWTHRTLCHFHPVCTPSCGKNSRERRSQILFCICASKVSLNLTANIISFPRTGPVSHPQYWVSRAISPHSLQSQLRYKSHMGCDETTTVMKHNHAIPISSIGLCCSFFITAEISRALHRRNTHGSYLLRYSHISNFPFYFRIISFWPFTCETFLSFLVARTILYTLSLTATILCRESSWCTCSLSSACAFHC